MLLLIATPIIPTKAGFIGGDEQLINPSEVALKVARDKGLKISLREIEIMATAMELENGCNSDLCLLYTGSVILNRVDASWYPDTIEGVLLQKGQYASRTVDNLYKLRASDRIYTLALRLAIEGSLDTQIIFQSMQPKLGTVKYIVDGEYFAY